LWLFCTYQDKPDANKGNQVMKQSEIQEVINAEPTAVFNSNAKYNGDFIITGFVKESVSRYAKPTTFALTQQVYFDEKTQTTTISSSVRKKSLRIIGGVFSESLDSYNAHKVAWFERSAKAKIVRAQNIDAMNEIKPQLARALKALNIDNKDGNYSSSAANFKIELDVDNADALLALLNTIALAQVK
jgi:hypothetical protein